MSPNAREPQPLYVQVITPIKPSLNQIDRRAYTQKSERPGFLPHPFRSVPAKVTEKVIFASMCSAYCC